jgi:hypothetical protein
MTATNHAVTGALVATAINRPLLALPAALLSHFVIDCLPHWDYYKFAPTPTAKRAAAMADLSLAITLITIFVLTINAPAWLLITGAGLGILPDTMWLPFILKGTESIKANSKRPLNVIRKYHIRIQWAETPKLTGLLAEIVWLFLTSYLLYQINN